MTEAFYLREHALTSLSLIYNGLHLSSLVGAQDSVMGGIQNQQGTWSHMKKKNLILSSFISVGLTEAEAGVVCLQSP